MVRRKELLKRIVSGMMFTLLFMGMLTMAIIIQFAKSEPTFVKAGTYYEHIVVNKSLTLVGEKRSATIIDSGGYRDGLYISASNVSISNFTIQNGGYPPLDQWYSGIHLYASQWISLQNNLILNNGWGVFLDFSHNNTINSNIIHGNAGSAILVDYSNHNNISMNILSGNNTIVPSCGIELSRHAVGNLIVGNIINNFMEELPDPFRFSGILVDYYSDNNTLIENIIANNTRGILVGYHTDNNKLMSNIIYNNTNGLILSNTTNDTMKSNILFNNSYNFGISGSSVNHFVHDIDTSNTVNGKPIYYLINQDGLIADDHTFPNIGYLGIANSTRVIVRDLKTVSNNLQGILFAYTTDSVIGNLCSSSNAIGITLIHSNNNVINKSILEDNANGVLVFLSNNNTIASNIFSNNIIGLHLHSGQHNIMKKNKIIQNEYGFTIYSDYNTIKENTIAYNDDGIYLWKAYNNTVYHNDFIENIMQVKSLYSNNTWDNGCEGSYWSDYNGTDLDEDGIGDEYLPWLGVDFYPLMSPYIEGDVNHDGIVNMSDIDLCCNAFGSYPEQPNWNCHCDINEDGTVNMRDISIACSNFMKTFEW